MTEAAVAGERQSSSLRLYVGVESPSPVARSLNRLDDADHWFGCGFTGTCGRWRGAASGHRREKVGLAEQIAVGRQLSLAARKPARAQYVREDVGILLA